LPPFLVAVRVIAVPTDPKIGSLRRALVSGFACLASVMPGRIGTYPFAFDAFQGLNRVTACRFAPPCEGNHSRGVDEAGSWVKPPPPAEI